LNTWHRPKQREERRHWLNTFRAAALQGLIAADKYEQLKSGTEPAVNAIGQIAEEYAQAMIVFYDKDPGDPISE
jgi:hypothetical protein